MFTKSENNILAEKGYTIVKKYKKLNNLPHWHTDNEIVYVSEGSALINVNNKEYTMTPGMCAFFKSGDVHYITSEDECIIHVIKTSSEAINQIVRGKRLFCPVLKNDYNTYRFFCNISDEYKMKKEYGNIVINSLTAILAAEIFRNEKTVQDEERQNPEMRQEKLLKWISDNYNHISFGDAAAYMNFSKAYFSKYFRRLTGLNFSHYINILKVSEAIDEIKSGNKSMTEISVCCGFGTIRSFNRVFKDITGYSPKRLPVDYSYPYIIRDGDSTGFDPILKCSEIID